MPDSSESLHAAEDLIRQLRGIAAPLTDQAEPARRLLGPVQRQADLLEQVLRRQVEFEKELVGRVVAPAGAVLDLLEQSAAATRAQARALETAATALKQASELLDQQAALLEGANRVIREPAAALKGAGSKKAKPRSRSSRKA